MLQTLTSLLGIITGLILVVFTLGSLPSYASGGIGGGGFSGSGAPQTPVRKREVDEPYEYGKAVFFGRLPGAQRTKYCVLVEGKPKKLKRSTLKPFKGGSRLELANAMYDCDNPDRLALGLVEKKQIPYVLYYLNKRFKLELLES